MKVNIDPNKETRVRRPAFRATFDLVPEELLIDCFCGGGGATTGIEEAFDRPVDIAINHSPAAIAMHAANHPETRHYCEDINEVDPKEACGDRRVGAIWFSPDCTHFSKAKGKKPLSKKIRSLAHVVIKWAAAVKPRVIVLENVEEFLGWGPLDEDNHPIKERAGEDFRAWLAALIDCGYRVEFRVLVAADFGAPTSRKRFFLIARSDGQPIVWPEPTHGKGREFAWRGAHEVIDWSIPCPSIFSRSRPLAQATLNRIARGIEKYVVRSGDPFIIPVTHQGDARAYDIRDPMRTVTAAHRGEFSLVEPFIVRHGHYSTKTGAGLIEGRGAGTFRGQPLSHPLATVCATNDKHLVVPFVTKHYGGPQGHATPGADLGAPLSTVTARDHHALSVAFLTKFYGTARAGASLRDPVPTITAGGQRGGGHIGAVRAFLTKYYGAGGRSQGQSVSTPLHTVTAKARFGLITVHGEPYRIVDIGMRMLQPRELFNAQDFPVDYDITPFLDGKPLNKTQQTALAGNAVPRSWPRAIMRANLRRAS